MPKPLHKIILKPLSRDARRGATISIAPPSGRQLRPISIPLREYRIIDDKPQTVAFSYSVDYVRRRGRRTLRSWVRGETYIRPRFGSSPDAQTAFVLHHDSGEVTEIVQFEGDLWWSLPGDPSASDFMDALVIGDQVAVALLCPEAATEFRPYANFAKLNAREVIENRENETLAGIQKGAQEILIVDGRRIFVREGYPLYVLWDGNIPDIGHVDQRISRVVYRGRSCPAYDDVSNVLLFGRIFNSAELAEAEACAQRLGLTITSTESIETVLPQVALPDPIALQIDVAIRKLVSLFQVQRNLPADADDEVAAMRQLLERMTSPGGCAADRALALLSFVKWCDEEPRSWKAQFRTERRLMMHAIEHIKTQCQERERPCSFDETLSPEDNLALARLSSCEWRGDPPFSASSGDARAS